MTSEDPIGKRLNAVLGRIRAAESRFDRRPYSVALLAVSKTRSVDEVAAAAALGQRAFGENYLQDALPKLERLADERLEWHFIGRLQSNKTKTIAARFDWVHSLADLRHARRLSEQRPAGRAPLNLCIQVDTSGEASKEGVAPAEVAGLAAAIAALPRVRLRGLMTLPAPATTFARQRRPFRLLRELFAALKADHPDLDTLSMGMSDDLEAAIAEGATLVRIGTAIFGPRGG